MAAKYAVSLMALLGSAAAQGFNSSSIASATTSSAASTYTDGAQPTVGGVKFLVQTDTSYQGTVLTLSRKRQSNSDISSCLSTCAASTECVGTAFVEDTMSCIYYSSVDPGTQSDTPGTDFAIVESRATASGTSSVFNSTTPVTSMSATRTPGASGNSTTRLSTGVPRPSVSVSNTTSSAAPTSTPSSLITIRGVLFLIEIDISYSGITINFAILAKRAGQSLSECLNTCAANTDCAGTQFEDGVCTFYSSITSGSRVENKGSTFATVVNRAIGIGAGNNGTAPTTPSNVTAESLICPAYNGAVITSSVNVTFAVSCGQFLIGTTYDAAAEAIQKRQAIDSGLPQTISNCVDICSLAESCVGATFNLATEECSYYNVVQFATPLAGFDSATRVQDNNDDGNGSGVVTTTQTVGGQTTTVFVAAPTTATVYTTLVSTVTVVAGAGAVTAYPGGAVVTSVVSVGQITYTNTVSTITLPQNVAVPTVTVTIGAGAVTTVTVDQNGNVIGQSTANAVGGGAGAAYPTVTVHDTVSVCPTTAAAAAVQTTWTTVYYL